MPASDQRRWRADKIADLANIAAGVLIFGQFASRTFSWQLTIIGLVFVAIAYFYANSLLKK